MRARLVVFPVRGRNWCFSRSIAPSSVEAASYHSPSTLKDLWKKISSSNSSSQNAELLIDFVSNKMNRAWIGLEKAPEGTLKNKIHGLGLKLLARVKPSEIFLKSISKEVTGVEITYPSSLNARLVRRRLQHIATRGAAIHKKYFYGSLSLLPLTTAFSGSEKLLQLVSDRSQTENLAAPTVKGSKTGSDDSEHKFHNSQDSPWVLQPSKELEELIHHGDEKDGLSKCAISDICKTFSLNANDVLKFRHTM